MADGVAANLASDDIFDIVLAAPDQGNALDGAMANTILTALRSLPDQTKAVVLTAEGADFCAGRRGAMPTDAIRLTAIDLRKRVMEPVLDLYQALRNTPVPVIAAIQGRAFGVGAALAGLADVAIAAEDAQFAIPEMGHDIPPTLVMTALVDRMPRNNLAYLVLTQDTIGARDAQALGIVSTVVPAKEVANELTRVRSRVSQNSVHALHAVKAFLTASSETSFATRRDYAALVNAAALAERFR